MDKLNISPDLQLPAEAVTQTFAILAKRGAGKTYTGKVMSEEMIKSGTHLVVIDPIGVWWGLRAGADGKSEGLPIVIAGGDHADIPLEATAGETLAELVVDNRISIVIDMSRFRKNEQVKFMTDFAETLYRKNRTAIHLMIDEADTFAPQKPYPGEQRMLGAIEDLVRKGRARGIGVTMITQRPAILNKNVLTQIEVLVALRMTAPLDQKAIDEWIKTHADEAQRQEFMASLPSLPIGTAYFWSPGWLDLFQKIKVRKLTTLDTSSTPKVGERGKQAEKMAPVDLDMLREKLAATIEQVKADDPTELKRQIKDLKKQLADQKPQEPDTIITQVEVLPRGFKDLVSGVVATMRAHADPILKTAEQLEKWTAQYAEASDTVSQFNKAPTQEAIIKDMEAANARQMAYTGPRQPNERLGAAAQIAQEQAREEKQLTKAARTILGVLAQYPEGRTRIQISIISQYSKKSSSFSNALGELRSKGLISPAGQEPITITDEGQMVAEYEPLPSGLDLFHYWQGKLDKASSVFLGALYAVHPAAINYDELQERTGYSRTSSSFSNALGKLRSLELVTKSNPVKISDVFFEGE